MDKYVIKNIQRQIIKLLPDDQQRRGGLLLADSCSEVARLVAGWIKASNKTNCVSIIKGIKVRGTQKAHDILAVTTVSGQTYIIDPTIWQFFPKAKSILLFVSDSMDSALDKIKTKYGGRWLISESSVQVSKNNEKKYLKIIAQNIRENIGR
jgi:hypothetical protein